MLPSERLIVPGLLALALAAAVQAAPLAFHGAEGFGRNAVGGRGGEVSIVTTLADAGPGSLRDALSKPGRTIVFEVGGVIRILERLIVPDHTTIAGQTAPGGGITIYGNGIAYHTQHVITRHIRIRMGRIGDAEKDAVTIAHGSDLIWDHVSMSWGRDGTFDANPDAGMTIDRITVQDCIIGQGLQTHSTGGLLITDGGASVIRTLYIDNNSRNPKARRVTQFVNNVIYNWTASAYILGDTEGRSDGYLAGNYFISGPNTTGGVLNSPTPAYHVFAKGNYYDSDRDGILDGRLLEQGDFGSATWHDTPSIPFPAVRERDAQAAFALIPKNAGANRWRDPVDSVMLHELATVGKVGVQISDEVSLGLPDVVGRIPSGTAPRDTDRDGMPDAWESRLGLNPQSPADRNLTTLSAEGYTNLEMYLGELAGDPVLYRNAILGVAQAQSWRGAAASREARNLLGRLQPRENRDAQQNFPIGQKSKLYYE